MVLLDVAVLVPFDAARCAQRAFSARLVFFRADADSLCVPLDFADPPYVPTKAVSASFSADNCFSTRARSSFNRFTNPDRFALVVCSPRFEIVSGATWKRVLME